MKDVASYDLNCDVASGGKDRFLNSLAGNSDNRVFGKVFKSARGY